MTRRKGLNLPRSDGRMISWRMGINVITLILRLPDFTVAVGSDRGPANVGVPHSGQRGLTSPVKLSPHLRRHPLARRAARWYGPRMKAMLGQPSRHSKPCISTAPSALSADPGTTTSIALCGHDLRIVESTKSAQRGYVGGTSLIRHWPTRQERGPVARAHYGG